MDFDIEQLKEKIKSYTDEEIIKIIFIDRDDYVDEVITIVEDEYSKRGIDEETAQSVSSRLNKQKKTKSNQPQADLGIKWLRFWNYLTLPSGGMLGILYCIVEPDLSIIYLTYSILLIATVFGLHYRKLWAWRTNWIIIILVFLGNLIPNLSTINPKSENVMMDFIIRLTILTLFWYWPQSVYWRKRKILFENQSVLLSNEQDK